MGDLEISGKQMSKVGQAMTKAAAGIANAMVATATGFSWNITQLLQIALIGLAGRLGRGLLSELAPKNWVGKIHCYSETYKSDYSSLQADLMPWDKKLRYHSTITDALQHGTDLALICTGARIRNHAEYEHRDQLLERMFSEGIPKVFPAFQAMKDSKYTGLKIVLTNPTGAFLTAARTLFDIPAEHLTSFPPDTMRGHGLLCRVLRNFCEVKASSQPVTLESLFQYGSPDVVFGHEFEHNQYSYITHCVLANRLSLPIIGEHGGEIPLFDYSMIGDLRLCDIHPVFATIEFQHLFTNHLRGLGHKVMCAVEKDGGTYYTPVKAAAQMIEKCAWAYATSSNVENEHVYTYSADLDAFLSLPATIAGNPLRVAAAQDFAVEGLTLEILEECRQQAEKQRSFIQLMPELWKRGYGYA